MTSAPSATYLATFSEALVSEIKAEMGRRDLSSRALGRLLGRSSQYMSDRLDGGNSKTGRRVTLTVKDLAAIAGVFELHPAELIRRAKEAADGREAAQDGGRVVELPRSTPSDTEEVAAHDSSTPITHEQEAPDTP
ncbi:hypothetical protein ASC77_14095 [Nocardioides sp. Root1257]|uniref:hypothetical protein n=1 Tax=unclassified Nocardioides TaxID=2615069 RepID=UPI0006F6ECDD|nr:MULTISPECIES: hypothetical protein [unclassified Nocardioides]KQW47574.1 hypothetical protein ASC77_14095 [Nocardioides sp. Root1257]KRC45730.1 hypothetical protein ASE24_14100 [Nocardioides sp. Root224]